MTKTLLKYLLPIILFALFSTNTFAQAPQDPGDDPMKADSAKYMISLQAAGKDLLLSASNVLSEEKKQVFIHKKSETVHPDKNDEEGKDSSSE